MPAAECLDTCDDAEWLCGTVCGESCGVCGQTESCIARACELAVSCTDCSLSLELLDRDIVGGRLRAVTIAMEYKPANNEPAPRVADFRIRANHDVQLVAVETGVAITRADKKLYEDPSTGKPWQLLADGSYQLLAHGLANTEAVQAGRLMTLTFTMDALGPVNFQILRRQQTFAPPAADAALQISPYDAPMMVTR